MPSPGGNSRTVALTTSSTFSSRCACLCRVHMRTGRSSRAGRSAQVELHRDDGGPSEERDEEGGVVTLGASAGRCPGPATAAEVEPRLLRTYGACERAVCLRYGRLVTDLVDSRLLSLLTTRYGASRSHIRGEVVPGTREGAPLRPDVGHSEPSCGVKINAASCLLDIRTAGLPSWSRVASLSLGPSVPWRARSSNSSSVPPKRLRGGAGHVLGHAACQPPREPP